MSNDYFPQTRHPHQYVSAPDANFMAPGSAVKPALGLRPDRIWAGQVHRDRINEILDAMERYALANRVIPEEWQRQLTIQIDRLLAI